MEYVQMTLDQWLDMKDQLKQDILDAQDKLVGMRRDFVKIGFKLRKIEELRLYEKDGYKSVAEFAKAECKLTSTDVTRFMQINEKYSVGGYSEELRQEFLQFGSSKLAEMLTLPDADMEMLRPEATRGSIRELKTFNKTEPVLGVADDVQKLIEKFYEDNPKLLNKVCGEKSSLQEKKEVVNPSGNRSYKKGMYFLMMYENNIKIKKFGSEPQTMSWEEFFKITEGIFETAVKEAKDEVDIERTSRMQQSETEIEQDVRTYAAEPVVLPRDEVEEEIVAPAQKVLGKPRKTSSETDSKELKDAEKTLDLDSEISGLDKTEIIADENHEKTIAPAQKVLGNPRKTSFELSKKEVNASKVEAVDTAEEVENIREIVEKAFGTRKEYMESLTIYGMAEYLTEEHRTENLTVSSFTNIEVMKKWLSELVDAKGQSLEKES